MSRLPIARVSLALALALALAVHLVGCASGPTAEVEAGPIAERVVARGAVVARDGVVRVRPRHFGIVTEVRASVGDAVEQGALLAIVEGELRVEEEELRAERAGVVIARRTAPGDSVGPVDPPLFELVDTRRVDLRFELEEEEAGQAEVGQRARVVPRGGGEPIFVGEVARLSPGMGPREVGQGEATTPAAGRVRAGWIELPVHPELPIGRELEVILEREPVEVEARVPLSAIEIREGRPVVRRAGSLRDEEVPVRVGRLDGEHAEVSGIEVGARVRLREAAAE